MNTSPLQTLSDRRSADDAQPSNPEAVSKKRQLEQVCSAVSAPILSTRAPTVAFSTYVKAREFNGWIL
jgi:hypothetical protein